MTETATTKRKDLTSTIQSRTLYELLKVALEMDATAKKIVDKFAEIQRQIKALQRQANSLKESLDLIGYRPDYLEGIFCDHGIDMKYADDLPFKGKTLVEACKHVLKDHEGHELSKTQVEYLVSMGGYEFSTDNPKNSVDVTLRRLANEEFCRVDSKLGPQGNRYIWTRPLADHKVET